MWPEVIVDSGISDAYRKPPQERVGAAEPLARLAVGV